MYTTAFIHLEECGIDFNNINIYNIYNMPSAIDYLYTHIHRHKYKHLCKYTGMYTYIWN